MSAVNESAHQYDERNNQIVRCCLSSVFALHVVRLQEGKMCLSLMALFIEYLDFVLENGTT